MKRLIILIYLLFPLLLFSQDANKILKISEEKIRGIESSYQEMMIKIIRPKWSKEMTMKGWSVGEDYFHLLKTLPFNESFKSVNKIIYNFFRSKAKYESGTK